MRPRRLAPFLVLLIAACAAGEERPLEEDFGEDLPDPAIHLDEDLVRALPLREDRSLLVTEPRALGRIQADRALGRLLGAVGRAAITTWAPAAGQATKYGPDEVARWVDHPLRLAAAEYRAHDALPTERRLGMRDDGNPVQRVRDLWPSLARGSVGDGPFRLLAVVNRMDLAGDADERGIIDAAKDPRSFGEMRLVFGLVDRIHERRDGRPYPMTFIIEYRLPALDADYDVLPGYDHRGRLFDDAAWRTQMERWGLLWRSLSAWEPGTAAHRDQLWRLVVRVARADNFVALRSNAKLARDGRTQFELREWYVVTRDEWNLLPRKPRDEPYRCGDGGADLVRLVEHHWDAGRGDLDMARPTPADPTRIEGYNVPRGTINAPFPMSKVLAGCATDDQGRPLPFEMAAGEVVRRNMVTAPFARASDTTLWRMPGVSEAQRHAFAIRTCSGCHSQEAGVLGFHIAPRMPGEASKVSSFLRGGASFGRGGVTYRYDELADRAGFVRRASERAPSLSLFEGLYRHDAD